MLKLLKSWIFVLREASGWNADIKCVCTCLWVWNYGMYCKNLRNSTAEHTEAIYHVIFFKHLNITFLSTLSSSFPPLLFLLLYSPWSSSSSSPPLSLAGIKRPHLCGKPLLPRRLQRHHQGLIHLRHGMHGEPKELRSKPGDIHGGSPRLRQVWEDHQIHIWLQVLLWSKLLLRRSPAATGHWGLYGNVTCTVLLKHALCNIFMGK